MCKVQRLRIELQTRKDRGVDKENRPGAQGCRRRLPESEGGHSQSPSEVLPRYINISAIFVQKFVGLAESCMSKEKKEAIPA